MALVTEGEAVRSLTIIYGFFFMFMSGMLAGAQSLNVLFTGQGLLILYSFVWLLALAFLLIGFELIIRIGSELGKVALLGLLILSIITPLVFLLVLGTVLVSYIFYLGRSIAVIGFEVFFTMTVIFMFYILWKTR